MEFFSEESLRVRGTGVGIFGYSGNIQLVGGVYYIDRDQIKILPVLGVICTPNPDTICRIVFPDPKISRRWTTVGTTEWWWYVAGEYGGGAWSIDRPVVGEDTVDYSDLRLIGGLDWKSVYGCRGFLELGYVFYRQVRYRLTADGFDPEETVMIRAGVVY
jgi:hypothetical protein